MYLWPSSQNSYLDAFNYVACLWFQDADMVLQTWTQMISCNRSPFQNVSLFISGQHFYFYLFVLDFKYTYSYVIALDDELFRQHRLITNGGLLVEILCGINVQNRCFLLNNNRCTLTWSFAFEGAFYNFFFIESIRLKLRLDRYRWCIQRGHFHIFNILYKWLEIA